MTTRGTIAVLPAIAMLAFAAIEAQTQPAIKKTAAATHSNAKTSLKQPAKAPAKSVPAPKPAAPAPVVKPEKPPVPEADVLIVALGSLEGSTQKAIEHTARKLVGGATSSPSLRDIQMTIVRKSAPFGPVILLVPTEAAKGKIADECAAYELCEWIDSGTVQVRVANHEGPWIRDFGPQVEAGKSGTRVVHWKYYDVRQDDHAAEMRSRINEARLALIEHAFRKLKGDDDPLDVLRGDDESSSAKVDRQLNLLSQMDAILANASVLQRNTDDRSAFDIAQAVLANPRFEYVPGESYVDGGNLLRMADGRCLTTRTLLSRNKDLKVSVDQDLVARGSCSQVTFLEPLPGPVIEHVDMFALPAGPKKILLASFDLRQPYIGRYWEDLSSEEKALTHDAAIAMQVNARRLRESGYEVVEVPMPLPRTDEETGVYYPTVLNALVRFNGRGSTQVLLPVYDRYEDDVQAAAIERIRSTFPAGTDIVPIDSTEAAKLQGAVHCLTLTLPRSISIFGDVRLESDRRSQTEVQTALEKDLKKREPARDLNGTWIVVEEHAASSHGASASAPSFEFDGKSVSLDMHDGDDALEGTFKVTKRQDANWAVTMKFDENEMEFQLRWLDSSRIRLLPDGEDEAMILVRRKRTSARSRE
jgi:agmatine/peptidylarginine deiminase